jgi:sulfur-oxidizing protein SoxX
MRRPAHLIKTTVSAVTLLGCLGLLTPLIASAVDNVDMGNGLSTTEGAPMFASAGDAADAADMAKDDIAKGKELAFDRKKGNCLACHQIEGGSLPGNIGPPLVAMKARFPDFNKLKTQITDARINNPNTIMPPFGPNYILTEQEINLVAEFVYTL